MAFFWLSIMAHMILSIQFFLLGHQLQLLNEVGRIVFPFLVAFTGSVLVFKYNQKRLVTAMSVFIKTICFLLLADALVRLSQNEVWLGFISSRYDIKSGGLLFSDSNFNGFIAGFMLLYLLNTKLPIVKSSWIFVLLACLIVLSASLAVYVGILAALFVGLIGLRISVIVAFCSLFAIFFLTIQHQGSFHALLMAIDGSLATKFLIAQEAWVRIWSGGSLQFVFGSGSGLLKDSFRFASHNFFGLASELGVLYVVSYLLFFLFLFRKLPHQLTTFVFLGLVGGISLLPVAYMACVYLLLAVETRFKRKLASRSSLQGGLREDSFKSATS